MIGDLDERYRACLHVLDIMERGWVGYGDEDDEIVIDWLRSVWLGLPQPQVDHSLACDAFLAANSVMSVMLACGELRLREYDPLVCALDDAHGSIPIPAPAPNRFQALRRQVEER